LSERIGFKLRLTMPGDHPLGPGKAQLMELIKTQGSIRAAGAAMAMSYRRAWLLVDELNAMFREPVVSKAQGGKQGGGATLTPFGEELLLRFRSMERRAEAAMDEDMGWLEQALQPRPADPK
jgi:molybdate transport system regulatory protein